MDALPILSMLAFPESMRPEIPKVLYRRFSKREHACAFLINGEILIRNLLYYRGVEDDSRTDPLEGTYRNTPSDGTIFQIQPKPGGPYVTINGVIDITQSLQEPERFFMSCFSYKQHHSQEKFGLYLVTIHDPAAFINRITNGILTRSFMHWGCIKYYDTTKESDCFIFSNISHDDGTPIWMMKSKKYSDEYEFRIVIELGDVDELWKNGQAGARDFDKIDAWRKGLEFKIVAGDIRDIASLECQRVA